MSVKVAVVATASVTDTAHVLEDPVQSPPHPVNVDPIAGAAVSVTDEPVRKRAEHVAPHETPAGLDVTVPAPFPDLDTVTGWVTHRDASVAVSRRPPVTVLPDSEAVAATEPKRSVRICSAVSDGEIDAQSATAPEMWGVAIEVPLAPASPSPG